MILPADWDVCRMNRSVECMLVMLVMLVMPVDSVKMADGKLF